MSGISLGIRSKDEYLDVHDSYILDGKRFFGKFLAEEYLRLHCDFTPDEAQMYCVGLRQDLSAKLYMREQLCASSRMRMNLPAAMWKS